MERFESNVWDDKVQEFEQFMLGIGRRPMGSKSKDSRVIWYGTGIKGWHCVDNSNIVMDDGRPIQHDYLSICVVYKHNEEYIAGFMQGDFLVAGRISDLELVQVHYAYGVQFKPGTLFVFYGTPFGDDVAGIINEEGVLFERNPAIYKDCKWLGKQVELPVWASSLLKWINDNKAYDRDYVKQYAQRINDQGKIVGWM